MKAIQRLIYTGFAAVAIASASMPVFPAHTVPARDANWREQVAIHNLGRATLLAELPPLAPRAAIIDRR